MRFIPAEKLQPGMVLARDILSCSQAHMLRSGVTLTSEYVKFIRNNGYMGAYILDGITDDVQIAETIPLATFEDGVNALRTENIGRAIDVAKKIVDEITSIANISVDLLDLRSYDDYTFHHSINVAIYATIVGKKMGLTYDELVLLCQAGLFHDLGKSKVPIEILNKPGRLEDEEYEIIKKHPKMAFDMLSDNFMISPMVKQAVLMHHENENGSGYPLGREGSQIPVFAKILHAVDVYDALTSKRPYKEPYAPVDAFEYLWGGMGILFDEKVVNTIVNVIPAYPPGTDIKFSNGESAVVVDHTDDVLRPVVRILPKGEKVDLSWDPRYDNVYITESGITPPDYAGEITALNEARQSVRAPRIRIMIIDDAKLNRMQLQNAIGNDYEYIMMESGVEAINYIAANRAPDLIIMDVEMPVLNGIQTAQAMRFKGFTDIPIMFVTNSSDRNTVIKCREVGAIDYIKKPAKPIYIKERVEIALKHQRE